MQYVYIYMHVGLWVVHRRKGIIQIALLMKVWKDVGMTTFNASIYDIFVCNLHRIIIMLAPL